MFVPVLMFSDTHFYFFIFDPFHNLNAHANNIELHTATVIGQSNFYETELIFLENSMIFPLPARDPMLFADVLTSFHINKFVI